eukprot:TRINITY_DN10879_c1_g1_i2.p2 TRINITY_DN10879_c1_g1~~TRINITY_DN10879_c1_g1_i2.p2  ORF type:complete len:587 (+),score=198.65 TRINITY_DN10879_c1_g1_i2:151-1911(+)
MPLFNDSSSSDDAEVRSDAEDNASYHTHGSGLPRTASGIHKRGRQSMAPRASAGPPLPARRSSTPMGRQRGESVGLGGKRSSSANRSGVMRRDDSPAVSDGHRTPRVGRSSQPPVHSLRGRSPQSRGDPPLAPVSPRRHPRHSPTATPPPGTPDPDSDGHSGGSPLRRGAAAAPRPVSVNPLPLPSRGGRPHAAQDRPPQDSSPLSDPMMLVMSDPEGQSPGPDTLHRVASPLTEACMLDPGAGGVQEAAPQAVPEFCSSGTDIHTSESVRSPQSPASPATPGAGTEPAAVSAAAPATLAAAHAVIQEQQVAIEALEARLAKAEAESGRVVAQLAGVMERMNNEFEDHQRSKSPKDGFLKHGSLVASSSAASREFSRSGTSLSAVAAKVAEANQMQTAREHKRLQREVAALEGRREELEELIAGKTAAADLAAAQREEASIALADVAQEREEAGKALSELHGRKAAMEADVLTLQDELRREKGTLRAHRKQRSDLTKASDEVQTAAAAAHCSDLEQLNARLSVELADLKVHHAWACQVLDRLGIPAPAEWDAAAPPPCLIESAKLRAAHLKAVTLGGGGAAGLVVV